MGRTLANTRSEYYVFQISFLFYAYFFSSRSFTFYTYTMNMKVLLSLGFLLGVCIHATHAREWKLEERNRSYKAQVQEEGAEVLSKLGWWKEWRRNERVEEKEEGVEENGEDTREEKTCEKKGGKEKGVLKKKKKKKKKK